MFTVTLRDKASMLFLRAMVRSLHTPRIFTVSIESVFASAPHGEHSTGMFICPTLLCAR